MSFFDSIMAGLSLVASFEAFFALFAGICIGVVGGAIPGLSATMAVALTLPFTFSLQPITGILLLLGVYKGGIFGGSIPAILIKTPGTPASSATILDVGTPPRIWEKPARWAKPKSASPTTNAASNPSFEAA